MEIRVAGAEDAQALLEIYAPYVENTAVSFEYEPPTVEEFRGRICRILERYPYLAAVEDGKILGYAYAGPFHPRPAYDWCVETTVYVAMDCKGRGVGKALYGELERILAAQNIRNLYACIASPREEDETLTRDSVKFHTHMGYQPVGEFHNCGYKFKRWYNMVWMEKQIGEHPETIPPVIPFPLT